MISPRKAEVDAVVALLESDQFDTSTGMALFYSRTIRMPSGCLEWQLARSQNYGVTWWDGKRWLAHRLAWFFAYGPIPEGNVIRHYVCDNPPCCEITHLRAGTQQDNLRDMFAKGRNFNGQSAKTHCPSGHPYDAINTGRANRNGGRRCRACHTAREIVRREAARNP